MKRIYILLFFFFALTGVKAQYEFIENKGQYPDMVDFKCRLPYGALYLQQDGLVYNFADPSQHTHSHAHHGETEHVHLDHLDFHAYKVHFLNTNPSVGFHGKEMTKDYCNYFKGQDPSHWASHVHKYRKVHYEDLYPGIDLLFYDHGKGLKYDINISPGANPELIQLKYEGVDKIRLRFGKLQIITSVNKIIEEKPYAYQIIDGDTVEVACKYTFEDNILQFTFPDAYYENYPLIIDPTLVFSTYTGSTGDNWGFTATWDYNDNVYSGGIVFDVGYPTTLGAYQSDFAGGVPPNPEFPLYYGNGCDIGIIKYNEDGSQRLFATYIGGETGEEMPHSMVVNEFNELCIFGVTGSNDFPVSSSAFDATFNGGDSIVYDNVIGFPDGTDIYVVKLSEDGSQLLGGTYLGGSSNDGLNYKLHYTQADPETGINYVQMHGSDSLYYNYGDGARGEIITDPKNNIYIGSNTFSSDFSTGILNGYQQNHGGNMDGVVCKLSKDLDELIWSSYFGSTEDECINSIYPDASYNVYVTGGTVSQDIPTSTGAYNTTFQGGTTDAFIAKFNQDGNNLLASTYFGSDAYDQGYFVRTDNESNVFLFGQTEAGGSDLVYNAAYSNPNSGQVIAKFSNDLSNLEWSTVFGDGSGRPEISPSAFTVDVCDRIYIAGWGREWTFAYYNPAGDTYQWTDDYGTKGMPVTGDAFQSETDGQDFYIAVFSEDASALEYATFFGELHYDSCSYSGHDHVDGGTSRFDKKGNIIQSVCGSCGGCQEFPTYPAPGVWSNSNNSTNCNNAVFKINIIENLATANFNPLPPICIGTEIQFENNSLGQTFSWDFGDGNTSVEFAPSHTYDSPGTYEVQLIVEDNTACNYADTMTRDVTVIAPESETLPTETICPGESVEIGPDTQYSDSTSFLWTVDNGLNDNSIQNPTASPDANTDYILLVEGICTDTVYQSVELHDIDLSITAMPDTMICEGDPVSLSATTSGNEDELIWSDHPSFSSVIGSSNPLTVYPETSGTYYVQITENFCNTSVEDMVYVEVHEFDFSITSPIVCYGESTTIELSNNNPDDLLSYQWQPLSEIDSGEDSSSPVVSPDENTSFYVTLTDQRGCTTTAETEVSVDNLQFLPSVLTHIDCYGDCTGTAMLEADGMPPYTFAWGNGMTGNIQNNLCAGNYEITVTDVNDCQQNTNIEIVQPPPLITDFVNVSEPECDGIGLGSASISAIGGTPPYTYSWSDGTQNETNDELETGTNYVTITDNNGCDTIMSINMIPPNNLQTSFANFQGIECFGDCTGNFEVNVNGGTAPYSFTWDNGASGNSQTNLCAGTYNATIIDAEQCVIHQHVVITQPDSLYTNINSEDPIMCHGETTDLSANVFGGTQPYSLEWNTGISGYNLENTGAGTYYITAVDSYGCEAFGSIVITQPDALLYQDTVRNMICTGVCNGMIQVFPQGGTPPYSYDWSVSNPDSPIAQNLCSGDYAVSITDDHNCQNFASFFVDSEGYIPPLDATTDNNTIYRGMETYLEATDTDGYSYQWGPDDGLNTDDAATVFASPEENTTYEVTIVDSLGCTNTDTISVLVMDVVCGEPYLYIPNAFTPNGDGENDFFKPYAPVGLITDMYFAVYDRWGELLYETDNIHDDGWDGTYKGKELPPDVYVFYFNAGCINEEEFSKKGNVTLIR